MKIILTRPCGALKNLVGVGFFPVPSVLLLATLLTAAKASITWDGSTSGNWNTAANWDLNRVPNTTETVIFPAVASNKAMNNDRPVATDFAGILFQSGGYSVTGNSFDLSNFGLFLDFAGAGTVTIAPTLRLVVAGQNLEAAQSKNTLETQAVNLNGFDLTLSGAGRVDIQGIIANSVGTPDITKIDSGAAILGGFNNFQGNVLVNAGTLYADGAVAGTGTVTVAAGATLAGSNGGVTKTTTVSGTLSPGSIGDATKLMTFETLTFASASTTKKLSLDIAGTTAGTNYDQVEIGTAVTLNSATLELDFGVFAPAIGTVFTFINKTSAGAISGTFSGIANGSTSINGGQNLQFSYLGGTGNDFTATVLNALPVAGAQTASTNEDTALPITLVATDANGQALTYSIVTSPTHGTLTGSGTSRTYTPTANYNGPDSFTFKANDGTVDSVAATVSITVNPVNDAPSFTKGSNQTVAEDAAAQTIAGWATAISDGDSGVVQVLTFSVTNTNNALFAVQPAVTSAGALTYTPAANVVGTATVSVSLTDDATAGGAALTTAVQTFTITLTPVNDIPTFVKGANQTVSEDAAAQTVVGWATSIDDGDSEVAQALSFNVSNNNNPLFSVPPAVTNTGTLTYTPVANANGSATVSISLTDDATAGGAALTSAVQTFTITISPVNDAPSFVKGGNQTVSEDVGFQIVPNWATSINDGDPEVTQVLTFNVTNDNNALFSSQPSVTSGGILTYNPAANANGSATVSISLTDDATAGGAALTTAVQTFTITVSPVNDVPSFLKGANQTVNEDAGAQTVAGWATSLNDGDPEIVQTLSFTVTNTNAALFAVAPAVSPAGTLTYTPVANANGSATVSVSITDDATAGGAALTSAVQTFTLTVTPVNDPPSFVKGANQTVVEDFSFLLEGWATSINDGDAETFQALTFNVTNDNNALFATQPSVTSNGRLSFSTANNAVGTATVSVSLTDDAFAGGAALTTAVQTFTITITPVNDPPTFVLGADQVVDEDAGPQTVANFATSINDGDPEVTQALAFNVTNNNPTLFATQPALSSTGTLTYTAVANASGAAFVIVTLTDDATAGGAAVTVQNFFTITVSAVNDPPVANAASFVVVRDTARSLALTGSDVEGSPLTFAIVTPPAHGSFGATTPPNLRYTPAPGYTGPDSFTFTVNDGNASGAPATITLNVAATATATWDGGGADDNWSTPQNWVGDTLPVEGSSLVFPDAAARRTNLNDLPVDFVVESITITGNGYGVGFIPGGALSNRLQLRSSVRATGAMPTSGASLSIPLSLLGPCLLRNEATALNGLLSLNKSIETNGHDLTLDDASARSPISSSLLLRGSVTGGGKVIVDTAGVVECTATNFWTGGTEVRRGTLLGAGSFSVRGPLTIGGGAGAAKAQLNGFDGTGITLLNQSTLDGLHSLNISDLIISSANTVIFRSGNDFDARLFIAGSVQFEAPFALGYPITLTGGGERAVSVAANITASIGAPFAVSNGTRLVKTGTGTLKLRNPNNLNSTGLCEARQGTLTFFNGYVFCPVEMNGAEITIELAVPSAVASLTALAGGGRLTLGETVGFPGSRVATMPVAAGATLNAASTLRFPLEATGGRQGAGSTGTGRLEVTGSLVLNGAALQLAPLENFFPAAGETFTLMTNDGSDAIVGTFAGVPEGQILTIGNRTFRCSYLGGDGNDFTITMGVLPTGNTRVWTGAGNNNLWSNPQNWVGNVAPVEGDSLEIPDGALRTTSVCDLPQGITFQHLHVGAPSHLRSGDITLMGGLSRNAPSFGDVQLGLVDFLGSATVETTGFGSMTVASTLRTAEMLVTTGASSLITLTISSPSPASLRKVGMGTLSYNHGIGIDPQLLPAMNLSAEEGTVQVRALKGNIAVGGQGAVATVEVLNPGNGSTVPLTGSVTLLSQGVLKSQANAPFQLQSLVLAGGTMLPNANSQMTVQVGIVATAVGTWDLPGVVTFSEATFTGGSVGVNTVAGANVRCVGGVATDNFGSFATKTGLGTLEFAGNQPFSNPLIRLDLTAGTFRSSSSTPTLIPRLLGGTLAGTGSVGNVSTISSGTIAPGASPGVLSTKNLVWNASTTYQVELAGATPGTGYDQLSVTGTVQLGGAVLAAVRLGGFVPTVGQSFVIISNDAAEAISGTFAGLAEGAALSVSGQPFTISYHGGDGNDVALTATALPPSFRISTFNLAALPGNAPGRQVQMSFTGPPGTLVRLRASTDLLTWTTLSTTTTTAGGTASFDLPDPAATTPRRFYILTVP